MASCPWRERSALLPVPVCVVASGPPESARRASASRSTEGSGSVSGGWDVAGCDVDGWADGVVCLLIRSLYPMPSLILKSFQFWMRCTLLSLLNHGQPFRERITVGP